MTSLALTFHETTFNIAEYDQQIWITSREIGQALGYAREDAVNKIYERNSDEFSNYMSRNVKMTLQGQLREVRVFSLRGAHLIAMFARTPVAKEFRKWVLDILDKEILQQQIDTRVKINAQQQAELKEIVDRRCEGSVKRRAELWSRPNQHFKIPRYSELLAIHFQDAMNYLETMVLKTKTELENVNVKAMAIHLVWLNGWWKQFGGAIRVMNPHMAASVHDFFNDAGFVAWMFIEDDRREQLLKQIENYPWDLSQVRHIPRSRF